jgi:hypothetical protein
MSTRKRPNAFSTRRELASLQEIPNIGPSLAQSLERAGIKRPRQLKGKDPYRLYAKLCQVTGVRHDPCVLDTFISAVRYMEGGPAQPWWHFTPERRETLRVMQARCRPVASGSASRWWERPESGSIN